MKGKQIEMGDEDEAGAGAGGGVETDFDGCDFVFDEANESLSRMAEEKPFDLPDLVGVVASCCCCD